MEKHVTFDKLSNTRDLGGMKTLDNRKIISGKLFRSGHLNEVSFSDRNKLSQIGPIIIDLRTDAERNERPDVQITGVKNIHIPIVDNLTAGISRESGSLEELFKKFILDPKGANEYMREMYKSFASDTAVSKYSNFVRILIQSECPVLWHCTAGKDRAGIGAVIGEEILGVPREDIISDYLRTNAFIENDVNLIIGLVKGRTGITNERVDESIRILFGAMRDYIDSFYQAVNEKYGSISRYILEGMALSGEEIKIMKDKYLTA